MFIAQGNIKVTLHRYEENHDRPDNSRPDPHCWVTKDGG